MLCQVGLTLVMGILLLVEKSGGRREGVWEEPADQQPLTAPFHLALFLDRPRSVRKSRFSSVTYHLKLLSEKSSRSIP